MSYKPHCSTVSDGRVDADADCEGVITVALAVFVGVRAAELECDGEAPVMAIGIPKSASASATTRAMLDASLLRRVRRPAQNVRAPTLTLKLGA